MKMDNKNQYKLFGTMNMFDIIPDFVYLVFEKDGKYYFENSDNSSEIDSFSEINKEYISKIKSLTSSADKLMNIKQYYTIGDEPLVAFQTSEESCFIGTSNDFNNFVKDINIEDEILAKNISDFQDEMKLAYKMNTQK